jgi:uncharacterized GH25 family protein
MTMRYVGSLISIGVFCFICFFTVNAQAHYMWLNAHDYTTEENRTAKFTVGWGHAFYNPVGDILVGRNILDCIYMIGPDGKKIKITLRNEFLYESTESLAPGDYVAVVQRKDGFSTKTKDGYKRQSKKGLKGVIHARFLGMCGKAIINVGDPTGSPFVSKPVGTVIEIVPLVNPAELKAGDYFKFQLLCQGKPVAEYINATYVGFSNDGAWAYSTRTNKDGMGEIKILNSGIWVLKANHKKPYPNPEEADEYSFTTSLTFEVR